MTRPDPYEVLGLSPGAGLAEARAARRRLAMVEHPDIGGDAERMQAINAAFDAVIGDLTGRRPLRAPAGPTGPTEGRGPAQPAPPGWRERGRPGRSGRMGVERDAPSFVVEALPVEAFEALLIVTGWLGEVINDEPPYLLEVLLRAPFDCWCRLDLVPDAGASTVSLTVVGLDGAPHPSVEAIRDLWVGELNRLGGAYG